MDKAYKLGPFALPNPGSPFSQRTLVLVAW